MNKQGLKSLPSRHDQRFGISTSSLQQFSSVCGLILGRYLASSEHRVAQVGANQLSFDICDISNWNTVITCWVLTKYGDVGTPPFHLHHCHRSRTNWSGCRSFGPGSGSTGREKPPAGWRWELLIGVWLRMDPPIFWSWDTKDEPILSPDPPMDSFPSLIIILPVLSINIWWTIYVSIQYGMHATSMGIDRLKKRRANHLWSLDPSYGDSQGYG